MVAQIIISGILCMNSSLQDQTPTGGVPILPAGSQSKNMCMQSTLSFLANGDLGAFHAVY